jgi:general secretion pathway protein G
MRTLHRARIRAFTLIEIMLVVMIIAILAGSAIHLMRKNVTVAEIERARADIQHLATQLEVYRVTNGSYPSTEQGIAALVTEPAGEPKPRRWQALVEDLPYDPWGQLYQIRNPATRSKSGIDLFSIGPDQRPDTSDDIGNWKP